MTRATSNNVRGPTSALTEFLRESGITPTTVARRAATRTQNNEVQPTAGPSQLPGNVSAANDAESPDNDQDIGEGSRRSSRLRSRMTAFNGYTSDDLDELEGGEEDSAAPAKKRRKTKAPEGKLKEKGKKKKEDEDDYHPEEDTYTALSRALRTAKTSSSRPPVGSFEDCPKCGKQFTVTRYTICADPGPGFLCYQCAKDAGDPFKKPAVQRKRKAPADKRQIQHFEERRFPTLISVCIQLITKHIDDVEALGDIGTVNMEAIAKALAKNRSLTPENAHLFYGAQNTSLILYDCTKLTPPALQSLPMLNPNLTSLRLDFCGQLDADTFAAMSISLPHLNRLELLGPFLVRSEAWITFFKTHPHLEGFLITQCPRFDLNSIKSLASECQTLTDLRLKEMRIDDLWLQEITSLKALRYLDLSSPAICCSENALIQLLREIGPALEVLDLSKHDGVTDGFLEDGLGKWSGSLERLSLQACPEITDRGVSRLFDVWIGGETSGLDGAQPRQEVTPDGATNEVDGPVRSWNRMARRRSARQQQQQGMRRASGLKDIDVPPCHNVPLVMIDLGRNRLLGSRSLGSIMRHSGVRLELLNINGWKDVSIESLQELGDYAHELRKIDVGWCRSVDDTVLAGWVGINIPIEGSDKTANGRCLKLTEIKVWGCNRVKGKFPQRRGVVILGIESV